MIDRHRFRRKQPLRLVDIIVGADADDTVRSFEQRIGYLTGNHIGFIGVGDRHQHISILRPSITQNPRMGSVPLDRAQIKLVLQLAQLVRIGIDDGDVIILTDQVFRQRSADLPRTKDDNFHN